MPGIHVRSIGKLDWVERGNEPVLTIPGAYWLCHKKHIYKFTFKWHKTLRNTEGFAYPKELTKVIRRILKSQPRQGQQFGTRHLLVTYNHSAWMRQDKMFAMLKFRERTDATAFPHAFVLTVQTLNDSSGEEQPRDKNRASDKSNAAKADRVSMSVEQNEEIGENNVPEGEIHDGDVSDSKPEGETEEFDKNMSDKSGDSATSSSSKKSETEGKNDPGKRPTGLRKSAGNVEYLPRNKTRNRRRGTSPEKKKHKIAPDSPAEKAIAADFADLPYQYIIEKEIERTKVSSEKRSPGANEGESSPGPSHKESDLPGKSLPRSPRAAQAETARSANITDLVMEGLMCTIRQDHDSVTVVEQKTKLEMDEVLENSEKAETKEGEKCLLNSSLLRLENLITKIEMSEARSKGHEEATIKKYDSPVNGMTLEYGTSGRNCDAEVDRSEMPKTSEPPTFSFRRVERSPIVGTPKIPLVKINLGNVREVLSDKLRYPDDIEIPEAAQDATVTMETDETAGISKDGTDSTDWDMGEVEEEEDEVGIELKYDPKDDSEPDKPESDSGEQEPVILPETLRPKVTRDFISDDFATSRNPPSDEHKRSGCGNQTVRSSPRIISNKIVTVDEIPPAMQKALNATRLRRKRLSEECESVVRDKSTVGESIPNAECMTPSKSMLAPSLDLASENQATNEKMAVDSPPSAIDITEEFQRELADEKRRKPITRRKSLRQNEDASGTEENKEPEMYLDMWKFMQDITNGVKVVVQRLDLADIPNRVASPSSPLK